jgi:hypothetical protein
VVADGIRRDLSVAEPELVAVVERRRPAQAEEDVESGDDLARVAPAQREPKRERS